MYTKKQLDVMGITSLKQIAKDINIKGYTKYRSPSKDELIEKILEKQSIIQMEVRKEKRENKRESKRESKRETKENDIKGRNTHKSKKHVKIDTDRNIIIEDYRNVKLDDIFNLLTQLHKDLVIIDFEIGNKLDKGEKLSQKELYSKYQLINKKYSQLKPQELFEVIKDFYERFNHLFMLTHKTQGDQFVKYMTKTLKNVTEDI
jgi:hypothetical protein